MHTPSISQTAPSSTAFTERSRPMVPTTYAHIVNLSAAHARGDRAAHMPLLGFLTGLVLAVGLWSVIGWLAWVALN